MYNKQPRMSISLGGGQRQQVVFIVLIASIVSSCYPLIKVSFIPDGSFIRSEETWHEGMVFT